MKKAIFTLYFFILSINCMHAQNGLYIIAKSAPSITYRLMMKPGTYYHDMFYKNTSPNFSSNFAINIGYKIDDNLFVETGIQNSNFKYYNQYITKYLVPNIKYQNATEVKTYNLKEVYYLKIPLILKFQNFNTDNFIFHTYIGISPNYFLYTKYTRIEKFNNEEIASESKKRSSKFFEKLNLSLTSGIEGNYKISNRIDISLAFEYDQLLLDEPYNQVYKNYYICLWLGLKYNL